MTPTPAQDAAHIAAVQAFFPSFDAFVKSTAYTTFAAAQQTYFTVLAAPATLPPDSDGNVWSFGAINGSGSPDHLLLKNGASYPGAGVVFALANGVVYMMNSANVWYVIKTYASATAPSGVTASITVPGWPVS